MAERSPLELVDRSGFPRPADGSARPFVWAHRGASALEPENTLRAFLAAADAGADGVELDIQLTRDGVAVVVHDPLLWTDGSQLHLRHDRAAALRPLWVRDLDWTDLEQASVRWPDGRTEHLTRFEEVLEVLPGQLWLDVELKAGWTYDPALATAFVALARRRSGRILASSFDQVILRDVAAVDPEIPLLSILHARPVDLPGVLAAVPAAMASIDRPFLGADDVRRWTDAGVEVSIGGSELLGDLDAVLTWPVAGVFLDDPRLAAPAARA
ncbi:MAG TPA: glycerophosphodiester phosphodiesterase [Acidimicrobiales bacterium]|jgi:glycerophosphoryl diester phosphodiesterase|nr:glycerophosphodiester phosphodiesterase [Acidimicrobiales bacterium]